MTSLPDASSLTLEQQVALLSGETFWRTQPLPDADVPSAVLSDGPHGLRFQGADGDHLGSGSSRPATCFPPAVTLASTWDEALAAEVGRAVGVEARALGVDVVLGPGLNIKRHPRCGRNFEYFSEDPRLTGRLAAAVVEGIQSAGVGACLKHFAVNNQESHRFVVDAVVDERTMREIYLAGFEHAVTASRPWTVMAAYNLVNGHPATAHHRLLTTILREEWGFDGLVMSDWGAVSDRVAGVAAGLDLEMPSSAGLFDADVLSAVRDGTLPAEAVATCARRVLDLVARSPRSEPSPLPVEEHDALARRVAAEGTVLLSNDGLLPLSAEASVALVGAFAETPRYQGAGSSLVTPTRLTPALDALRSRGVRVTYARGYDPVYSARDQALIDEAVEAARTADVAVVMVGLPAAFESEGFDRDSLDLPAQHNELVRAVCAANPRTVVALSNGAPVRLPWRDEAAAVLESYLGGQASGAALVDVLYGDVEPAGRLAETFPSTLDDVAADPWFPGHPHQVEYREGLFVGYRHHVSTGIEPAFPFGHGLGYSRVEWSQITVDRDTLTPGDQLAVGVTLTNTGDSATSDVVQVYVRDETGVVLRPLRELAGFAKVRLQPSEQRTVQVDVPARAFEFYDVDAAGWRAPNGRFVVEVARSSVDVVATAEVTLSGGVDTAPEPAGAQPIARTDQHFAARLGHPVPQPRPVRPFTRDSTIGELAQTRVGALLKTVLWRAAPVDEATRDDPTEMHMLERGLDELPLRSAAIFSRGTIRWPLVDTLLAAANGRYTEAGRRAVDALMRRRD